MRIAGVAGGPAAWTSACWPGLPLPSAERAERHLRHQGQFRLRALGLLLRPGRTRVGGGSVKLGGMASGARVVTVNSSGVSRTKPKVRPSSLPLHAASIAVLAASAMTVGQRPIGSGIADFLAADRGASQGHHPVESAPPRARQQAVEHQRRHAANDRGVGEVEHIPGPWRRHGRG